MIYKSAACYLINNNIFIQGYALTTDGLSQLHGDVFVVEKSAFEKIGQNIMESLEKSGEIISHPSQEEWSDLLKESFLLKVSKMKTWNILKKSSKYVDAHYTNDKIVLTPSYFGKNGSNKKNFHLLTDKAITCTDLSPEILGVALIKVFELCE